MEPELYNIRIKILMKQIHADFKMDFIEQRVEPPAHLPGGFHEID